MGNNKIIKPITDSLEFFESDDLVQLNSLLHREGVTVEDLQLACKRALRRQRDSKYGVRAYNSLNKKFEVKYMVEWGIITSAEAKILEANCINNLLDLLRFNLEDLVCGTPALIDKLDEVRKFYDLREYCDLETAQEAYKLQKFDKR
jgi:hypothetical protein